MPKESRLQNFADDNYITATYKNVNHLPHILRQLMDNNGQKTIEWVFFL